MPSAPRERRSPDRPSDSPQSGNLRSISSVPLARVWIPRRLESRNAKDGVPYRDDSLSPARRRAPAAANRIRSIPRAAWMTRSPKRIITAGELRKHRKNPAIRAVFRISLDSHSAWRGACFIGARQASSPVQDKHSGGPWPRAIQRKGSRTIFLRRRRRRGDSLCSSENSSADSVSGSSVKFWNDPDATLGGCLA